jgi:hypothetical protein
MHGGFGAECPGGAHEPRMPAITRYLAGQRIARMQIERHAEPLDLGPERPVLRQVVIDRAVGLADLREAVHQRALEAEVLDAAHELARGGLGVLHRQRREAREAVRAAGHLLGQGVVGEARHFNRPLHVGDRLHGGRVERQDEQLHPVAVHEGQAFAGDIEQPGAPFRPQPVRQEAARILDRLRDGEMLFQPDLSVHAPLLPHAVRAACRDHADARY